jgi:hypothetical protein
VTVEVERMMRIAVAFARSTATPNARLCGACLDVLHVSGAGITVMSVEQEGPLCASDDQMSVLEDLQFVTGIGPCRDAFATRKPVHAAELGADSLNRWPAFVDRAVGVGIGAVFAYPLSGQGGPVGVLTLYQHSAGELTPVQHDDSLAIADVLGETLLSLQDAAPAGRLATGLEDAVAYRAQVHQASGMVAVQLQVSAAEALVRMRGYAYAHVLPLEIVATQIVAGELRLADDRPEGSSR